MGNLRHWWVKRRLAKHAPDPYSKHVRAEGSQAFATSPRDNNQLGEVLRAVGVKRWSGLCSRLPGVRPRKAGGINSGTLLTPERQTLLNPEGERMSLPGASRRGDFTSLMLVYRLLHMKIQNLYR